MPNMTREQMMLETAKANARSAATRGGFHNPVHYGLVSLDALAAAPAHV